MEQGKVILLCGKVGSGKSYYANKVKDERNAVVLSCDKLMTALFTENLGVRHNSVLIKTKSYLYELACDIVAAGANVILDFGFWQKAERKAVKAYFDAQGIETELCYIRTTDEVQIQHLESRNNSEESGNYFIDDIMMKRFNGSFEEPDEDEIFYTVN